MASSTSGGRRGAATKCHFAVSHAAETRGVMKTKILLTASAIVAAAALSSASWAQQGGDQRYDPAQVDARITKLHDKLQITSSEEPMWSKVAGVIRSNAEAMQQAYAQRHGHMDTLDASRNLHSYAKSAEVHAHNMARFADAFDSLYRAMPTDQKKVADQVFRSRGKRF
jgi:cell pole-organizing protein PopZ